MSEHNLWCQQEPNGAPIPGTEKCTAGPVETQGHLSRGFGGFFAQRAVGERSEMPPRAIVRGGSVFSRRASRFGTERLRTAETQPA